MIRCHFLLALLCGFFNVQAGTITGVVRDARDSSTMVGVVVSIPAAGRGTTTDMDGRYEIQDLADGTYSLEFNYVTYSKQTRVITISANNAVTLDIIMRASGNQLTGATVSTTRRTNTESAVVLEIKKASVAVSGISAAQISKTQDRNAADVVKRVPGVTIQDDRFIVIRGLADRYNTTWLNDAGAPSSEIDKKAFSFDLIPSGLIDRILIFKTPAADLPGDFAGGMVKIYTASMPAKTEYNFAVQGSYRSGSTGTDFNYLPRHSGDILGYDNGSRNIPGGVPESKFFSSDPNIRTITQSFENDWAYSTKKLGADLRLSGSAANVFKLGRVKLGNTFGFSYANTNTNYSLQQYKFDSATMAYHYNDLESSNKVNLAVLENLTASVGNSKIEFRNLLNQIATNTVTSRTSIPDAEIEPSSRSDIKAYQLAYENRRTYASQLSGSHHNDDNTRKYNWTLGYSSILRNQPGLRRLQYARRDSTSPYTAQLAANPDVNYGGGRLYGNLIEKVYSFAHQFTQTAHIDSDYAFDVSLGNYVEYKNRDYSMRELGYTFQKNASNYTLLQLPVDQIFATPNVGDQSNFRMADDTNPYDRYSAKNTLFASFLSVNTPIGKHIRVLAGLRYEHNRQQLEVVNNVDTLHPDLKTDFLLPSINITYNFSPKSLLRLAYGKTVNRPEFREQAPAFFYDFALRAGIFGSLANTSSAFGQKGYTVDVAEVHNVDARWEYYPSTGELIHVGAFYKDFKNPIQQIVLGGYGDPYFSFMNFSKAHVAGAEIDVRKNLGFVSSALCNLSLVGNMSIATSEVSADSTYAARHNAQIVLNGPMQGQSNVVINAGLFYQNDSLGLQGSILYNSFSPRVYAIGRQMEGNIGELAVHTLDVTLSKFFLKRFTFMAGVQNLLNAEVRLYEDTNLDNRFDTKNDKPYKTFKPGQYFTLGLKMRF